PECEKALDVYEGFPTLYTKKNIKVTPSEGEDITAMAYVMTPKYESIPSQPSKYYLNVIWEGYVDNKVPLITLRQAVAENLKEIDEVEDKKLTTRYPYFK
ncbi:gamma-glutamylcyclotransferase, partial [Candidatus Parcubacteria bacterium]|nr:gamma-glutamylcyclotransferase [Candidatus Parcubacteria bacterium]